MSQPTAATPGQPSADPALAGLRTLRQVALKHPRALQELFDALAREGRAYAQTAEGAVVAQKLSTREGIRRARAVWTVATLGLADEVPAPDGALPSSLVDAVAIAAAAGELEALLAQLDHG